MCHQVRAADDDAVGVAELPAGHPRHGERARLLRVEAVAGPFQDSHVTIVLRPSCLNAWRTKCDGVCCEGTPVAEMHLPLFRHCEKRRKWVPSREEEAPFLSRHSMKEEEVHFLPTLATPPNHEMRLRDFV